MKKDNLVPRAFSLFKMAVGETPSEGCQNGSKDSLEFCHVNTMKCIQQFQIAENKQGRQSLEATSEKVISLCVM